MGLNRGSKPTFTLIPMPEFTGDLETLSVKVPEDLKETLRKIGIARGRTLSEVAVHALGEYAKCFAHEVADKTKRKS